MICATRAFGPIDGDGAGRGRVERQDSVVLQQDSGLGAGAADQCAVRRAVLGALGEGDRGGKRTGALHEAEHRQGAVADGDGGDLAAAHRVEREAGRGRAAAPASRGRGRR